MTNAEMMPISLGGWWVFGQLVMAVQCCAETPPPLLDNDLAHKRQKVSVTLAQVGFFHITFCEFASYVNIMSTLQDSW